MSMPLVSIVLPTHNGQRYLGEAVAGCLRQTYPNIELIVVDDGSTDRTPSYLAGLTDPRLRVIRNERNMGVARSLNKGFDAAGGELLTWTSDDNLYEPTAIEVMAGQLRDRPDVGLVYADYLHIDGRGRAVRRVELDAPERLEQRNTVGACFLYRRQVLEAIGGYDPSMTLAEDYDYWVRISRRFRVERINRCLYRYRYHGDTLTTRRRFEASTAVLQVRRKYFLNGLSARQWDRRIFIDCFNRTLTALRDRRFEDCVRGWQRIGLGPWLDHVNVSYVCRSLAYNLIGRLS